MTKELEKFQGTWKQLTYEKDGIKEHADEHGWEPSVTFTGNTFVVTLADGSVPIKGTFTVDPTRSPKTIEYTDTFGADAGKTFPGIYILEADLLVFCVGDPGEKRPTAFRTRRGQVMRIIRREKPGVCTSAWPL